VTTLQNPKHEKFARLVADGMHQNEAYTTIGCKDNSRNASRLKGRPEVKARILELERWATEKAAKKISLSKADILQNIISDRELALKLKQVGAALRADELLGKAIGMFVDRTEIARPGEFEGLTDPEDIKRAIIALIEARTPGSIEQAVADIEEASGE
jgi:hypothetical protein